MNEAQTPAFETDPHKRLSVYWECLREQKDKKAVRDILEQELLRAFIKVNQSRINEFPLLEQQQNAIIHFLTTKATGEPLAEPIDKLLNTFINTLNKYGTQSVAGNDEGAKGEVPVLVNLESILVKSIQGVVYTTALTMDNFGEILLRYYGEEALATVDGFMEQHELSEQYWRVHFEHFIGSQVEDAYKASVEQEHYQLNRENGQLVIRYAFDDVLSRLKHTDKPVEKTRTQMIFAESARDFQGRKYRKMVHDHLMAVAAKPEYPLNSMDVDLITQITFMDSLGLQFGQAQTYMLQNGSAPAGSVPEDMSPEKAHFIREQLLAMACACGLALAIMRQDFVKALVMLSAKEVQTITRLVGTFDIEALERAFFTLLEYQFLAILREKAGDDLGKMQIRSRRERRIKEEFVDELFSVGLNRIRKNKLWAKDPDNDAYCTFRASSVRDFKGLVDMMHLEPALIREVLLLWEKAEFKVSIGVYINLELLSRTTTNLNQRLAEILTRFGVSST